MRTSLLVVLVCACSPPAVSVDGGRDAPMRDAPVPDAPRREPPPGAEVFVVATINVGTAPEMDHDRGEADGTGDGYTQEMATVASELYGNGLSWPPAEDDLRVFLDALAPDVVVFQEAF